jgi:hypothetical protein
MAHVLSIFTWFSSYNIDDDANIFRAFWEAGSNSRFTDYNGAFELSVSEVGSTPASSKSDVRFSY